MNDSFVYYKSFVDAMEILSVQEYGEVSKAINRYAIYGEEPDDLSPMAKIVFIMAKPQIDANSERRINGSKGGRPKKDNKETIGFENDIPQDSDEITIGFDSKKTLVFDNRIPLVSENDNQGFENEKPNVNVNDNVNDNDNANDNVNVNDNIPPISPQGESEGKKTKRFVKPTVEQVQEYCDSRNNGISGQEFIDYYDSIGWNVGKKPMKDWQAAVRTWENKRKTTNSTGYVKRWNV